MSTVKTTNIQHPSAASPNLTLAADGSVSGGAGLGGLVHIATESFNAVSSVSIDDVFSSTYDNYRVLFHGSSTASASTGLLVRLRVSGSDITTTTYRYNYNLQGSASAGAFVTSNKWQIGNVTTYATSSLDLAEPFLSSSTGFVCTTFTEGSNNYAGVHGGREPSGSVDGFTLYPDGAYTITGTIRIYGYANS